MNTTLTDIPFNLFSNFAYLRNLNMSHCGLKDLWKGSFQNAKYLNYLDISYNNFSILQKQTFFYASSLLTINATGGEITEIDEMAFVGLSKLSHLLLQRNKIKSINQEMLQPLVNLTVLDLSGNVLEVIDAGLFSYNNNLKYLYLDKNKIILVSDGFIENRLTHFVISHNQIQSLPLLAFESQYLVSENTNLTKVTITNSIKELDGGKNQISTVICDDSSVIRALNLSYNLLTSLGCIKILSNLEQLDISHNSIGYLDIESFTNLTKMNYLNLANTNITNVVHGTFSHQPALISLNLSYNNLGVFDINVFLACKNLSSLYMDGNKITEFDYKKIEKAIPYLKTLGLADNSFTCSFLGEAMLHLNNKINFVSSNGEKVLQSRNINGIGCLSEVQAVAPIDYKPVISSENLPAEMQATLSQLAEAIKTEIQAIKKAQQNSEMENLKFVEEFTKMNQLIKDQDQKFLNLRAEFLERKIESFNITESSSNNLWNLVSQLNNVTLERQQVSNEKQSQKLEQLENKVQKILERKENLDQAIESSPKNSLEDSFILHHIVNEVNFMKNFLIFLALSTLIGYGVFFYIKYKGRQPHLRRMSSRTTLNTNLELQGRSPTYSGNI